MSFLSRFGIAPKAEAWAVPSKKLLGLFSGPDVLFFDEAQARRAGGKVTPLVCAPDDQEEQDEELAGPFGGRQTSLGGNVWAQGFGAREAGPWQ